MSRSAKSSSKYDPDSVPKIETVNTEIVAMAYGSLVVQLLKDFCSVEEVNTTLEKIGNSMGSRLIEEFLAKTSCKTCKDFKEVMAVLADAGFQMFLDIKAEIKNWSPDFKSCTLVLPENPLNCFVELPPHLVETLKYSNLYCGIITGALQQLYLKVACTYEKDVLKGDNTNEIRVELLEILADGYVDVEETDLS